MLAVLGLGAGALVVDRVMLAEPATGPSEASATQDLLITSTPGPGADSPPGEPVALATGRSLAERLGQIGERFDTSASEVTADNNQTRDAFVPHESWVGGDQRDRRELQRWDETAGDFRAQHRLDAVMGAGKAGVALINGQAKRLGDRLGEFELIEIRERSAVFRSPRGFVELRLANRR